MVLFAVCLVAAPAWAQDTDVDPDRPGVSTGATTVPRGALQLESGIEYSRERHAGERTDQRTSVVTTLRYGLRDGVELRLDMEPFVALHGEDDATNVGDLSLGAKLRLLEGADETVRPTLSLLPSIKLPTAPDPIGSERVDVTLLALADWTAGRVGLTLNAGLAAVGQRKGYVIQGVVIGGVTVEVIDKLAAFGELFYNSPSERNGDDLIGAGAGTIYKITRDIAIDAALIASLAGRGPDYRVQTGITVRFWP